MDKWLEQWMNEVMNAWEEKEDLNEPIRESGESHGRLPGAPLVGVSAKEVSAW